MQEMEVCDLGIVTVKCNHIHKGLAICIGFFHATSPVPSLWLLLNVFLSKFARKCTPENSSLLLCGGSYSRPRVYVKFVLCLTSIPSVAACRSDDTLEGSFVIRLGDPSAFLL